jgi:hypothetical protein
VLALCALGGCALPPAITIAQYALDGISYVATGKSLTDHAISFALRKDCALMRIVQGMEICVDPVSDGEHRVLVAVLPREESWGDGVSLAIADDPMLLPPDLAALTEGLGATVAPAPEPPLALLPAPPSPADPWAEAIVDALAALPSQPRSWSPVEPDAVAQNESPEIGVLAKWRHDYVDKSDQDPLLVADLPVSLVRALPGARGPSRGGVERKEPPMLAAMKPLAPATAERLHERPADAPRETLDNEPSPVSAPPAAAQGNTAPPPMPPEPVVTHAAASPADLAPVTPAVVVPTDSAEPSGAVLAETPASVADAPADGGESLPGVQLAGLALCAVSGCPVHQQGRAPEPAPAVAQPPADARLRRTTAGGRSRPCPRGRRVRPVYAARSLRGGRAA